MWVYMLAGALLVIGLIGSVLGGGVFTIVLVPIALLVAGSAVVFGMFGRSAQGSGGGDTEASHLSDQPLPHNPPAPSGRAPTSPEGLADARRAQQ
jgi:hypothetical protein